jgi:hypothetical protein
MRGILARWVQNKEGTPLSFISHPYTLAQLTQLFIYLFPEPCRCKFLALPSGAFGKTYQSVFPCSFRYRYPRTLIWLCWLDFYDRYVFCWKKSLCWSVEDPYEFWSDSDPIFQNVRIKLFLISGSNFSKCPDQTFQYFRIRTLTIINILRSFGHI